MNRDISYSDKIVKANLTWRQFKFIVDSALIKAGKPEDIVIGYIVVMANSSLPGCVNITIDEDDELLIN